MLANQLPIVIGIAGKAGSGKDEFAQCLTYAGLNKDSQSEIVIVHLADRMKRLVEDVLGILSYRMSWGEGKERKYILGDKTMTGREILQKFGVAIRDSVSPHFWAEQITGWKYQHRQMDFIIVPDIRFIEEAELCDILVLINRDSEPIKECDHVSETSLDFLENDPPDWVVENNGTVQDLQVVADKVLKSAYDSFIKEHTTSWE